MHELTVLVHKMKKDIEHNKQASQQFYTPQQSIVDKSGSLVVSAPAIDRIINGMMMEASAVDFFLKIIQAEAHNKRIAIFPINFMQKIIENTSFTANDTFANRMFRRYEERNGWREIFSEADQLHFPILHSAHYSVISIAKLQEQHTTSDYDYYYRIHAKCSMGKDMDHLVTPLLTAIKNYYKFKGKQFNQDQWRRLIGRGAKRCAKQADNGLNCGVFVCFSIEMMIKVDDPYPEFRNSDVTMYRNHIIQQIMQFVKTHDDDYSMLEVTARGRADGKRVRAKPLRQVQTQRSQVLVDLTGGDSSDAE